jgi:hypothetical protein
MVKHIELESAGFPSTDAGGPHGFRRTPSCYFGPIRDLIEQCINSLVIDRLLPPAPWDCPSAS